MKLFAGVSISLHQNLEVNFECKQCSCINNNIHRQGIVYLKYKKKPSVNKALKYKVVYPLSCNSFHSKLIQVDGFVHQNKIKEKWKEITTEIYVTLTCFEALFGAVSGQSGLLGSRQGFSWYPEEMPESIRTCSMASPSEMLSFSFCTSSSGLRFVQRS